MQKKEKIQVGATSNLNEVRRSVRVNYIEEENLHLVSAWLKHYEVQFVARIKVGSRTRIV